MEENRCCQFTRQRCANIAASQGYFATARAILSGGDEAEVERLLCARQRVVLAGTSEMARALRTIVLERRRQEQLYPGERAVDGTGGAMAAELSKLVRQWCSEADAAGQSSFALILAEEVLEVLAETDPRELRKELVQVGAVCCKWLEALDERERL